MSSSNPLHDNLDDVFPQASNPYAAPREVDAPYTAEPHAGRLPVASQNRRLVNFLIDGVLTRFITYFASFVMALIYINANGPIEPDSENGLYVVSFFLSLALYALYFIVLEVSFGRTIGKLLTGTQVVNASGGKASLGQIVGRTFARLIPFEPLSFLFGDTTTGWHDTLSDTRVVRISR